MPPKKRKVERGSSSRDNRQRREAEYVEVPSWESSNASLVDRLTQLLEQHARALEQQAKAMEDHARVHEEQMRQLIEMQRAAQSQYQTTAVLVPAVQPPIDMIARLRSLKPPVFEGGYDPTIAEEWVKSLDAIFDYLDMTDADRVRCAVFQMTHNARTWWSSAKMTVNVDELTWERFKEMFFSKYFSKYVRARKARDFLELKQGSLSVVEYVQKFEEGCQYVPWIAGNDSKMSEHFLRGLRSEIRRDGRMSSVSGYSETVDKALITEQDEMTVRELRRHRRHQFKQRDYEDEIQEEQQGDAEFQEEKERNEDFMDIPVQDKLICPDCGKQYFGECFRGTRKCFYCKEEGHTIKYCSKRSGAGN